MNIPMNNKLLVTHTLLKKSNFGAFILFSFIFLSFFATRGATPYSSELNYIEYSKIEKNTGSVIPASCDANAPHAPEVCGTWQATACGSWSICSGSSVYYNSYTCVGAANITPPDTGCFGAAPTPLTCSSNLCVAKVGISFSGPVSLPPPTITSFTSTSYSVPYGSTATISWASANVTACAMASSLSSTQGSVAISGSYTPPAWTGRLDNLRTYTLSCSDGTTMVSSSVTINFIGSHIVVGGGGCFTAGTKVILADGSRKNIEDVTGYDYLMSSNGPERVMKRYHIPYQGLVYAFNGDTNYFVTPTHPFMTTEGWKSLDPEGTRRESPTLKVSKLTLGDTLILLGGKTKVLTKLDSKKVSTTVYNFGINGTHDFYADDYLVHNVDMNVILTPFVDKVFAAKAIILVP